MIDWCIPSSTELRNLPVALFPQICQDNLGWCIFLFSFYELHLCLCLYLCLCPCTRICSQLWNPLSLPLSLPLFVLVFLFRLHRDIQRDQLHQDLSEAKEYYIEMMISKFQTKCTKNFHVSGRLKERNISDNHLMDE